VIESAAKNCPTTPWRSRRGRKTTTVVIVDVVTGRISSCTASRIAALRSAVSARWRTMFSVTTTESSITRPIAIAIAPSVMRLNVWPTIHMTSTVIASVIGIDAALIAVIRHRRRNRNSTTTASIAPTTIASRTDSVASRTRLA
jgi:hypothetical protein